MASSWLLDAFQSGITDLIQGALWAIAFIVVERTVERIFKIDIKLLWIRHKRKPKPKQSETEKLIYQTDTNIPTGSHP